MKALTLTIENTDDIRGVTLEERAKMVLLTLGRTPDEISAAFRKFARRHHPDIKGGDTLTFMLINEAYLLLAKGRISRRPLLADDELILRVTGRRAAPLIDERKEREKYEKWMRDRFYGVGVF